MTPATAPPNEPKDPRASLTKRTQGRRPNEPKNSHACLTKRTQASLTVPGKNEPKAEANPATRSLGIAHSPS